MFDTFTQKFPQDYTAAYTIIPAYTKTHIYVEKINSITRCISKLISLIYFSIKITIKE